MGENEQRIGEKRVRLTTCLMTIAIIGLGQYIITFWSADFAGNTSLFNGVSFASAVVSIVLAFVAIVYTFVVSASQHQDSANLSSQIAILTTTVNTLKTSESDLSLQIGKLDEVSKKIDSSTELLQDQKTLTEKSLSEIGDLRQKLQNLQAPASASDAASSQRIAGDAEVLSFVRDFANRANAGQVISYWIAIKVCEDDIPLGTMYSSLEPYLESTPSAKLQLVSAQWMALLILMDARLLRIKQLDTPTPLMQEFRNIIKAKFFALSSADSVHYFNSSKLDELKAFLADDAS